MKKIPNPNGRKGCDAHQDLIQKIASEMGKNGLDPDTEHEIKLDSGKKRYIDVAGLNENGLADEFHQVGKQNKNGEPVARERRVIAEVEKKTGKTVFFHPYNLVLIVLIIALVSWAFKSAGF